MAEATDGTIGGISIARIQHLLDRQDIQECLERYIRGLDRHDGELIASAFWPDAQINYGESFSGPTAEFVPWAIEIEAQYLSSHHFLSTQNVDIQGDTAHIET